MFQQQINDRSGISRSTAFIALVLGNIAIAFGPLLVRLSDTGPVASGFWRLFLAIPIVMLLGRRSGFRWRAVGLRPIWIAIFAGIFFGIDIAIWHIGIFQTKMANATLFANCASLILVIYGIVVAKTWPSRWQNMSILLAFAGCALLLGQSLELSSRNFIGDILCLLAGLFYAVYLVMMIDIRKSVESWSALGVASSAAAAILLIAAYLLDEIIIPQIWWPVILLALSSQVFGQGCLTIALPHFSPLVIGLALLLQPAISASTAWLMFGEHLSGLDLIGGFMVMAALVLVRISDRE